MYVEVCMVGGRTFVHQAFVQDWHFIDAFLGFFSFPVFQSF